MDARRLTVASLDDVARAAGVSTATVSRALSGRGRSSEATRERVRAAADALGYVASATASSLASGRADNIGVVVPLMDRWFFARVLDGIAASLAPRGLDVTLYNVTDDPDQRRHVFDVSLRRGRVDGLIVLSVALSDDEVAALQTLALPLVGLGVPRSEVPALRVDDEAVGRAATEHLLALGHRDIVHLGHTVAAGDAAGHALDIPTLRRRGFDAAMADASASPRFVDVDFTVEGARQATLALLDESDPPTAIFAASDEMAYGVIAAARERGVAVPGDLSVIGVDGHDLAPLFDLTTIDQFPHAQGERAGEAILAAVDAGASGSEASGPLPADPLAAGPLAASPGAPDPGASLPFQLVRRGTTGPPPAPREEISVPEDA